MKLSQIFWTSGSRLYTSSECGSSTSAVEWIGLDLDHFNTIFGYYIICLVKIKIDTSKVSSINFKLLSMSMCNFVQFRHYFFSKLVTFLHDNCQSILLFFLTGNT